jgi:hypothetical protein
VKLNVSLADIMSDPNLSITSSPFAPGKTIVKRASFPKGQVPAHLRSYLIPSGTGRGMTGTGVYGGKVIPKTAINVARRYRGG